MVAGEAPTTFVVVLDGDAEVAVRRLDRLPPGLALVEILARVRLAAGHVGLSMVVRDPSPELCELLDLAGLAGVIEVSRA